MKEFRCECDHIIYKHDDKEETITFPRDIVPNIIHVVTTSNDESKVVIKCPKCDKVHRVLV